MPVLEVQTPKYLIVWAECGRIYLMVHERGRPTIKADWSMAEIDAALNALREEVLVHAEPLPRDSLHDVSQDASRTPLRNVRSASRG